MPINQIKAGAALNYVIIILNTLTGLLYTPYMLRCLGQNEYGLYSLVASVIAYLTILDFGFGNAIIRYTAKFRAEGKQEEQWQLFGMFIIVYAIIGIIAMVGGLILFLNVDTLFSKTMTESDLFQARVMMLLLTLNLSVTFPLSIFGSIISAYENFVFQRLINIFRILLSTGVMILLLSIGYRAISLVVVQTIFNILILIINYIYCKRILKIKIIFTRFNYTFFKEISIYSFWVFLNTIMDKIYWGTGQFVLGSLCGTVAVAIFSVAILLQQMYMTFSTAICNVLLPRITSIITINNNDSAISALFIKSGRIQCVILSFILAGFIVFGQGFIYIWAGSDYILSYYISLIFFGSLFIPLIQNTGIWIIQARNQMKFRSLLYLIISIISLIFQIILAKRMGALGCALSIGGALIIGQGIVMNYYYWKYQFLNIPQFWKETLQLLIVPLILTLVGILTWQWIDYTILQNLVIGIVIFSILYTILIWRFGINRYEKDIIVKPIRLILHIK